MKVGANQPNNHRFWGPSLEGNSHEYYKTVSTDGGACLFAWCRWEATNPGIVFNTGANDNWVIVDIGEFEKEYTVQPAIIPESVPAKEPEKEAEEEREVA